MRPYQECLEKFLSPQCHQCRWFKRQGVNFTCNLPGSIIGSLIHDPYQKACRFFDKSSLVHAPKWSI